MNAVFVNEPIACWHCGQEFNVVNDEGKRAAMRHRIDGHFKNIAIEFVLKSEFEVEPWRSTRWPEGSEL